MIGLDTNILVRYLTQDDVQQAAAADRVFIEAKSSGDDLWISVVTVCELVWVLESCYKLSTDEIGRVLTQILQIPQLKIENRNAVQSALVQFLRVSSSDFADLLIGQCNVNQGCLFTYTFDKVAAKSPTFKLLG